MTIWYGFGIEDGIYRTFTSESTLVKWLNNKILECGSRDIFDKWLKKYFESGNEIGVCGKHYSYADCIKLV